MANGDYRGMSDRTWQEQTGQLSPVEAAQAAVDRIAAGKTTLDEECERLGYSHEAVQVQMEAERKALLRALASGTAGHDGVPLNLGDLAGIEITRDAFWQPLTRRGRRRLRGGKTQQARPRFWPWDPRGPVTIARGAV